MFSSALNSIEKAELDVVNLYKANLPFVSLFDQ